MPEHDRRPERVLGAAGGPRPLPGPLRRRLEDALVSGALAEPVLDGLPPEASAATRPTDGAGTCGLRAVRPMATPEAAVPGDARAVPPELRERLEASLGRRRRDLSHARRWLLAVGAAAVVAAVVGLLGPGDGKGGGGTVNGQVAAGAPSLGAGALYRQGARAPAPHSASVHRSGLAPRAQAAGTVHIPAAASGSAGGSRNSGTATGGRTEKTGAKAPSKAAAPAHFGPAASTGGARAVRVVPPGGPAAGANTVLLEGSGLGQVRQVLFGGARSPSVRHVSASRLAVVVPPHAPGAVVVGLVPGTARGPDGAALHYSYR